MQWLIFGPYGALLTQISGDAPADGTAAEWEIERNLGRSGTREPLPSMNPLFRTRLKRVWRVSFRVAPTR